MVGISYDVKVDSFLQDLDSKACLALEELTADKLCVQIDRALSDPGQEFSEAAAKRLKEREHINRQVAARFLNMNN